MDIHIGNGLYVKASKFGFKPQYPQGFRGLLFKRGHNVKSWKARYFVLEEKSLKYFADSNCKEKDLKGTWILDTNSIVALPTNSIDGKSYLIDLKARRAGGEVDSLLLSAAIDTDRQLWLHALEEAIQDGVIEIVQPDVWHSMFKVEIVLHVQHGSDVIIHDGDQVLEPQQLISAPTVTFPRHGLQHGVSAYCLVAVDIDSPSRDSSSRHSRVVWLQANISPTKSGEEFLPFELKNAQFISSGIHRIFYVLLEQSRLLSFSSPECQLERESLSISDLARQLQLIRPVGIDGCYVNFVNSHDSQESQSPSPDAKSSRDCSSPLGPDTLDTLLEIPAEGLFRDTSSASEASSKNSAVRRENRRVSFLSSSSITTSGSPGTANDGTPPHKIKTIVSALKGSNSPSKKGHGGRRKSVSFKLDEEPLYLASEASFPEAVALDLIANRYGDDNDPPDYDLGSSVNRAITYSSLPPSGVNSFKPPKSLQQQQQQQPSLELPKPPNMEDGLTGSLLSPPSSSSSTLRKASNSGLDQSEKSASKENSSSNANGKNTRSISRNGSLNTSLSAILGNGGTFVEQLASIAHDTQLVCEFFRVSNKNIFNGGKWSFCNFKTVH